MRRVDPSTRPMHILLIDDNPADIELTRQCFQDSQTLNKVHAAMDAETALAFLRQERDFANAPRPDLILLDLNLPGTDGREILSVIKQDPDLLSIPVVVLTTSEADDDVASAYRLHANSYLRKPADLEEFFDLANLVCGYWFRCVRMPPTSRSTFAHRS